MSSDGYFEGYDLDDAAFEELDAIEAAILPPNKQQTREDAPDRGPESLAKDDSFYDLTLDIDENELQRLDNFIEDSYQGKAQPVAGPSRPFSTETRQTTLFGEVLPSQPSSNKPRSQIQRIKSTPKSPFGQQAPKTKLWDRTEFAKSGLKKAKGKAKAKGKNVDHNEEEDEEAVEFEQFPAPFVSVCPHKPHEILLFTETRRITNWELRPPPPMKLSPDLLEAKHWIYPLNQPKRDYQYNIVKHCLFENTIVALPTGLGKTFIAGVVMLNWYRWFPDGKIIFVAPTRPLVAQQIDASHQMCGIPGGDAAELTGQIPRAARGRLWKEKRIFYMTPQTLVNDLLTENCDPRDVILLVIDEAHKASGDYAYNQVVRFLMAKNPHFRILALTATPGSSSEAVQTLIDGLHISHIEIRDENSLDLKAFIHDKTIKQHIIEMTEDVNKVKDLLVNLMDADIKPLKQRGVLWGTQNPAHMHPYAAQARMGTLTKDQRWAYAPLSRLSSLARAMGYLIEGTMGMCDTHLQELSREKDPGESGPGKASSAAKTKSLRNNPLFQAVMKELEIQKSRGFSIHPKMDRLKTLVVQHFAGKLDDGETVTEETRAMVFVTFREAVDEIVDALNLERPLIRANKFIGQGIDKQGKKGLAQKEQIEVIKKFKSGEINVLVATSIGEEGLDIGEVDLIVCYDAQKTPIRMLQRLGRTGRKRAGLVHVLLAEGREEFNLDKAKETYKEVQKTIWRGDQLELYADVERLLPDNIKPQCLEKKMEIQEYVRDEGGNKRKVDPDDTSKVTKRKRNDDVSRNIPAGTSTGFVSVADLLVKGGKKRKKITSPKDFELAGQDDDTDMEIESGLIFAPPRRTKSSAASVSKKASTSKTKLRKAATMDGTKGSKKARIAEPTSSQGIDDADDLDIEQGFLKLKPNQSHTSKRSVSPIGLQKQSLPSPSPSSSAANSDIPISINDPPERHNNTPPPPLAHSMAWLVDEDDDPDIEIVDSSPVIDQGQYNAAGGDSIEFVEPQDSLGPPRRRDVQFQMDPDESLEFIGSPRISKHSQNRLPHTTSPHNKCASEPDESIEFIMASSIPSRNKLTDSPNRRFSKDVSRNKSDKLSMPPPTIPQHLLSPASPMDLEMPEPSFPVRPVGRLARNRSVIADFPVLGMPSPPQRRLHRRRETAPANSSKRKKSEHHVTYPRSDNPLFDFAAIHSGDETSEGSSDPEADVESESDRLFLEEMPETQVSPSYDQSLAYRQSLFTQAPAGSKVPTFANQPARHGAFGNGRATNSRSRPRPLVSSSPLTNDEPDEYDFGSFVVDDEAEISYISSD